MIAHQAKEAVDFILREVKGTIRLGTPLGLGKPNLLLNELYAHFKSDPNRQLEIYTALSLSPPTGKSFFEQRFYGPFLDRHFGRDYPRLRYVEEQDHLPANIRVHEFYFQAGQALASPASQRSYIGLNYTHAGLALLERGLNVIVQLVSRAADGRYSLSCNPDLTLDVKDLARQRRRPLLLVAVVHPDLPFLGGDAVVEESFFDLVLDSGAQPGLFALPRLPIDPVSHLIGLHASQLVADGGTLQIGIGSLSEALVHFALLRQRDNHAYRNLVSSFWRAPAALGSLCAFTHGLYGTSEMVMDGFMHLRQAGILTRKVREAGGERYLHGAFFLGSKTFYEWLRNLTGDDFSGLAMTRVSKVNDLYDADETALRRQRTKARFFNTCMKVTLLGGAVSDTLDDGKVVSGVGGQYNFVAMSHELPDSLSVLMLKSTRVQKGKRISNIVWDGGHLTIPRHLRDVVVTEYGVANLRGRTDEECIIALLEITDSAFQAQLMDQAKAAGKLRADYRIPALASRNTPGEVDAFAKKFSAHFPAYPFGSDFTPAEEKIVAALEALKSMTPPRLLRTLLAGGGRSRYAAELGRMGLLAPRGLRERLYARLLAGALSLA